MSQLWTEKYRPKLTDEMFLSPHLKTFLNSAVKNGFPHLLLYGPPGCGKTTFAHILAPDALELNASDERGIDVIRNFIKTHSMTITRQVVIMDECELLTPDAQQCLRRVLEDYAETRFIFITNYLSKIIGPLQSRCVKLRFDFSDVSILEKIGKAENVDFDYAEIYAHCGNDLRRAINLMQGLANAKNNESVKKLVGIEKDDLVEQFYGLKLGDVDCFVENFILNANSLNEFVKSLSENLMGEDARKAEFAIVLAEVEKMAIVGCEEEILVELICLKKIEIYG